MFAAVGRAFAGGGVAGDGCGEPGHLQRCVGRALYAPRRGPGRGRAWFNVEGCGLVRAFWGLSTRQRVLVSLVLLFALVPSASAADGSGVSRATAARDALGALRADRRSGAELVLGLLRPLPAGAVISVGGPERASSSARIARSPGRVVAVLMRRRGSSTRIWLRSSSTPTRAAWLWSTLTPAGSW